MARASSTPDPRTKTPPPGGEAPSRAITSLLSSLFMALTLAAPVVANPQADASDAAGKARPPAREVASSAPAEGLFEELRGSGFEFHHFNGMSGEFYMAEINSGGGAMLDYDNDGDLDLYLVQGDMLGEKPAAEATFPPKHTLPLTDRLYRNDLVIAKDGSRTLRFTDVTKAAGLGAEGYGFGIATGDYDGDGWVDLYVTRLGPNSLLRNRGDGTFENVTDKAGAQDERWSVPASFADADGDGDLDLYIGNYVDFTYKNHKICRTATGAQDYCGPSAYAGVPDRLLENQGDGTFRDITVASGIHGTLSKSLGVVAADFNGDGQTDFYVASDRTPNPLWIRGDEGQLTDEALLAGCAVNGNGVAEASMGVDAGDFDGDGDLDLFMTHLIRETNTLFANDGTGLFEDASIDSGLGLPSWGYTSWGTAFFDFDNDGWLDLMTANGAVKTVEALAAAGDPFPFHEPNQLFRNLGNGSFEDATPKAGEVFALSEVSRSISIGDLDQDGDLDALLVNNNGPARILINRWGSEKHWLGVRLLGKDGKRDQLGANARLRRPQQPDLWRRVRTDGSFAAGNDPRLHFGLGDAAETGVLRVHWPSGRVEDFTDLNIDRYTTLREGSGKSVP